MGRRIPVRHPARRAGAEADSAPPASPRLTAAGPWPPPPAPGRRAAPPPRLSRSQARPARSSVAARAHGRLVVVLTMSSGGMEVVGGAAQPARVKPKEEQGQHKSGRRRVDGWPSGTSYAGAADVRRNRATSHTPHYTRFRGYETCGLAPAFRCLGTGDARPDPGGSGSSDAAVGRGGDSEAAATHRSARRTARADRSAQCLPTQNPVSR